MNVRRDPRIPLTTTAGIGAMAVVVALVTGGSAPVVTAIAGVVTGLLAAVSLIAAASRVVPAHRRQPAAWRWMAAGSLTWLLGVGVRPVADGTPFVLTFADLLMLVGSVLLAIGCGLSVKPPAFTRGVLRQAADAYLGAASVFAVTWVAVLGPAFRKAEDTGAFFVALALPVVCLLATCAVTPAVAASRSGGRVVGLTGVGVLTAITVAEMATALARLDGDTPPLAAGLVVPAMLLVLAVAPWVRESRPVRPLPAALTAATPLVLVAVSTVIVTLYAIGGSRDAALVIVAATVVLVLLGRLFVLLVETAGMRRLVDVGEQQLRRLAENTGDVVLVCDPRGIVHEVGPGLETTYGYCPEDLVYRSLSDYIHPEDLPAVQALLGRMTDEDEEPERESGPEQ
ncbi:MAG: PAS domain S-box protein, partial [Microbispora sp.]|nr:PAS domain S-box protein [Microbispora sp.]